MKQEAEIVLPSLAIDDRPLSLRSSIAGALNRQPAPHVAEISAQLGLHAKGKRLQVAEIVRTLVDPFSLFHRIERLPTLTRRLLKTVLEQGGWVPFALLPRAFGSEKAAESPVRMARAQGVLCVGIAEVNGEPLQVAVIPLELREALEKILSVEHVVDLEADAAELARVLATVTDDVAAGTVASPLPLPMVEGFLTELAHQSPYQLVAVWRDIQAILRYCSMLLADDLDRLDGLMGYHVSEFAHQLAPPHTDVKTRRHMLQTWAAWFAYVARQGHIRSATAERVSEAVAQLTAPPRRLGRIPRPEPLGGELVPIRVDGKRVMLPFTFNDLWLLLAANADYAGDLKALHQATTGVPDGAVKRKRIDWLLKQNLKPLQNHAAQLVPTVRTSARRWFQHQTFNRGNAWLPSSPDE